LPFSFRHFLRQTPSPALKAFFDQRGVDFHSVIDWQAAEHVIARQIAEAIDGMSGEQVAPLISGLERAHALSDEHGIRALVNAADDPEAMLAAFNAAENDQDRTLRVLVESPEVFKRAEDVRYFDYRVEGSYGRRFRARRDATVSRDPAALKNFSTLSAPIFEPSTDQDDHAWLRSSIETQIAPFR
jgi:hypothetical protein